MTHTSFLDAYRIIDGIIESGQFGQELDVVNVEDGSSYTMGKNDAPLKPFYFMFYIPDEKSYAFLILQRIGSDGIHSHLSNEYRKGILKQLSGDFSMTIKPFMVKQIFDDNIKQASKAKCITIKLDDLSILEKLGLDSFEIDNASCEIRLSSKRNSYFSIREWLPSILHKKKEDMNYDIPIDPKNITIDVKTNNNKKRKLSLGNPDAFGTSMILDIKENNKGFPAFSDIRKEAYILIDYIKDTYGIKEQY